MEAQSSLEHDEICSFCQRPTLEVGSLVAGTGAAFICNECIERLFRRQQMMRSRHHLNTPSDQVGNFDRFTERARLVMTLAEEEAKHLNHNYIGTEHLLLGLVREGEGVAAQVLSNLGVELTKVRSAVEFIIGQGVRPAEGDINLTPRAKKVIALAVDESRSLSHHYIGTEHLLLGVIREGEGIAAGVLESLGVNFVRTRIEVLTVLTSRPEEPPGPTSSSE